MRIKTIRQKAYKVTTFVVQLVTVITVLITVITLQSVVTTLIFGTDTEIITFILKVSITRFLKIKSYVFNESQKNGFLEAVKQNRATWWHKLRSKLALLPISFLKTATSSKAIPYLNSLRIGEAAVMYISAVTNISNNNLHRTRKPRLVIYTNSNLILSSILYFLKHQWDRTPWTHKTVFLRFRNKVKQADFTKTIFYSTTKLRAILTVMYTLLYWNI